MKKRLYSNVTVETVEEVKELSAVISNKLKHKGMVTDALPTIRETDVWEYFKQRCDLTDKELEELKTYRCAEAYELRVYSVASFIQNRLVEYDAFLANFEELHNNTGVTYKDEIPDKFIEKNNRRLSSDTAASKKNDKMSLFRVQQLPDECRPALKRFSYNEEALYDTVKERFSQQCLEDVPVKEGAFDTMLETMTTKLDKTRSILFSPATVNNTLSWDELSVIQRLLSAFLLDMRKTWKEALGRMGDAGVDGVLPANVSPSLQLRFIDKNGKELSWSGHSDLKYCPDVDGNDISALIEVKRPFAKLYAGNAPAEKHQALAESMALQQRQSRTSGLVLLTDIFAVITVLFIKESPEDETGTGYISSKALTTKAACLRLMLVTCCKYPPDDLAATLRDRLFTDVAAGDSEVVEEAGDSKDSKISTIDESVEEESFSEDEQEMQEIYLEKLSDYLAWEARQRGEVFLNAEALECADEAWHQLQLLKGH